MFSLIAWVMWIIGILVNWIVEAEYSQIISITWFDATTWESWQLIQSFTQKWEDLEFYFVSNTWNVIHYTIMDRNLWATEVYNQNFSINSINTWSFGYLYQWWNNYGFKPCYALWATNFGNSCNSFPWWETTNGSQVPFLIWSLYMPSLYSRNIFVINQTNWMEWASVRDNIWWWSWDTISVDWQWTKDDRQWPCPNWYYVPSEKDWNDVYTYLSWWSSGNSNLAIKISNDLLLPPVGYRDYRGYMLYQCTYGSYRTSSPRENNIEWAKMFNVKINNNSIGISWHYRGNAVAVRCFKNLKNENIVFIHPNWWINAVIGVNGKTLKTLGNPQKTDNDWNGIEFMWWYSTENFIRWTKMKTWDIIESWMNLYARRSGDNEAVLYNYDANGWAFSSWESNILASYTISWEINTDAVEVPTKIWYTFFWWYDELTGWNKIETEIAINNRFLYAHWLINQYTITFDIDGTQTIITWDYGIPIISPNVPTKNGYKFISWEPEIPTTMPAENLTIKAVWEKLWSSWVWVRWNSNIPNKTPKEDNTSIEVSEETAQNSNIQDSLTKDSIWQKNQISSIYPEEFQQAYEFAKGNGITTMPTIQDADMNWNLTRIATAKMLSQYAINILWKKPANLVAPKFNDVTEKQNADYDNWVILAYQLWIMWQNMPNNDFRPNDEVTRAEFVTALSRMLYATSDWEYKSTSEYYTNHMKKLKEEWVITKDNPKMKELRGYVMIMLMRSAK